MRMTLSVESRNSVEVRLVGLGFNYSLKDWRRRRERGVCLQQRGRNINVPIHQEKQDLLAETRVQLYMSDASLILCFFCAKLPLL